MNKIQGMERDFMKKDVADFDVSDTVRVFMKIKEGDKTRLQGFEGVVIAKGGAGIKEGFTVRRISYGEGVERVFRLHSPLIDSISVIKKGRVKRAKLYYLRKKIGKGAKIEEARKDASLGKEGVS